MIYIIVNHLTKCYYIKIGDGGELSQLINEIATVGARYASEPGTSFAMTVNKMRSFVTSFPSG
jgi:hypothetical protein